MKKKKKQNKKRSPGIPALTPEEKTHLDALLKDPNAADLSGMEKQVMSPALALALMAELSMDDPRAVDLILAVKKTFDHKDVQKAVKKVLFKLKQKGVTVPGEESVEEPSILKFKPELGQPEASLGPIDGAGSRPVFVAIPRMPAGFQVGIGIVNDETGIVDFVFGDYSKKRMKEVRDLFAQNFSILIETSFAHAATLLEETYSLNGPGSSADPLRHYRRLRPYIQDKVTLLDHHLIYGHIPSESLAGEVLTDTRIQKLFEHDMMASWLFDLEKMEVLVKDIDEAENSQILISEDQKANRIREIKEKAVEDMYTDAKRLLLKGRLEENAYIFFKVEEETLARTCLLTAASLERQSSLTGANPFLMAMLERTLKLYLTATGGVPMPDEEEDEGPSIIVP